MTDIKPLHRRMRAKCKVCKEVFVTKKRLRVRQTCSEECYVKLQEAIKNEPIECAMCLEPMERVYGNRQRRTCSEKCRKRLIASHQNAQRTTLGALLMMTASKATTILRLMKSKSCVWKSNIAI